MFDTSLRAEAPVAAGVFPVSEEAACRPVEILQTFLTSPRSGRSGLVRNSRQTSAALCVGAALLSHAANYRGDLLREVLQTGTWRAAPELVGLISGRRPFFSRLLQCV